MKNQNTHRTRAATDSLITDTTGGLTLQHQQALALAAWGMEVHPLNGKTPRLEKWPEKTTADPNQIDTWWAQWPTANIGCQPPVWAVVLDVDPRNGGHETWKEVTGSYDYPTDTLVTTTGSGGAHVWYRLPYDGELRNKIGSGIDIQRKGKQLVMPGSVHPETGQLYEVLTWHPPAQWAVLPHHWRKHVYKPPTRPSMRRHINMRKQGNGEGLIQFVAGSQHGSRNTSLYWAACRAMEDGLDIIDKLEEAGLDSGLDKHEIKSTLNSARNATRRADALQEVS